MSEDLQYKIEAYGRGCIVADYSGKRGKYGAAYMGREGVWNDQPIGMTPFATRKDAEEKLVQVLS